MHRPKPRARATAATRARRSPLSPALLSPASVAPAAAATLGTGAPPVADAMHLVDLLDAHLDRLHGVHSVLSAMTTLLDRAEGEATLPRATGFQLQQLAKAGLGLAGESLDVLSLERCGLVADGCHRRPSARL